MPPAGGMWATTALRVLTRNLAYTTKMLKAKFATASRPLAHDAAAHLQAATVRAHARQSVHPVAWLRQQKRAAGKHWSASAATYTRTAVRHLSSGPAGRPGARPPPVFARASAYATSSTGRAVAQSAGRAPFASTLRPNLTGGTLPRTAGGYAIGAGGRGGARYFSHAPTAPAQVVQNVGLAIRAFCLAGQRARYDGAAADGSPRFRAVSAAWEDARLRVELAVAWRGAPGAFVDFRISPIVTALSPLGVGVPFATAAGVAEKPEAGAATLKREGFLDVLSVDFARALKDLAAVMTDLKKLAALGDLPIAMAEANTTLRVRFPGVDADTVERLCDDMGVSRGVVGRDPEFDAGVGVQTALRFPYAPDEASKTISSPGGSMRSHDSELSELEEDQAFLDEFENNLWSSSHDHEGYESMSPPVFGRSDERCAEGFEGVEGIHRFLAECDRARGRYRT